MGSPFVGLVHPCKIYNILRIGSPLLYIGPQPSHISEIIQQINGRVPCAWADHGRVEQVIQHVMRFKQTMSPRDGGRCASLADQFSKSILLPRLVATLESAVNS